jgi:glycine dehydrogenase
MSSIPVRPIPDAGFDPREFAGRHIGPRPADLDAMLTAVGYDSLDALMRDAIPADIYEPGAGAADLPGPTTEDGVLDELRAIASRNVVRTSMIGQGYYGTTTPGVIRRRVLENPGWYTAYTPYQPEISQGRLEALLNFQTVVEDLTGLPIAGASLLDEGTAAVEAMTLLRRANRGAKGVTAFAVDQGVFAQTWSVLTTRAEALGIDLVRFDPAKGLPDVEVFGVFLQNPGADGTVRDDSDLIESAHARGLLVAAATDLLACTLIRPPGEQGADVCVGSAQRFGVPMWFGGPHAGFIAVTEPLARTMPGRLVGVSVDADGAPAYRLALQTREQHIRREKATSNICTAQVLLAVTASMYAVYHGPAGLRAIAGRVHRDTARLAEAVRAAGQQLAGSTFFDTLTVQVPAGSERVLARARDAGIDLFAAGPGEVRLSVDETTTEATLHAVAAVFGAVLPPVDDPRGTEPGLPAPLARTSSFLRHEVFAKHRSETQLLRYVRSLSDKDYALDRGMIPLGSCTMKLNATAEMEAISFPGFANMHPFAPADATAGYRELIDQLEGWLAAITGYAAVSVQPNAGSQGELAGLLAIRAYHRSNGGGQRDVCLIPASAHGTNAASAVLAGLRVVVVRTGGDGRIDHADLRAKVDQHADDLAAIMVTYPSTHGVYEGDIREVSAMVHAAGGQVYIDGANLNALVGWARPGSFGGDVSHLNLHKTFCIPHGGGGPGVGPVAVAEHLVPFLPARGNTPDDAAVDGQRVGAVSSAPYGSAGILPIPWAYIRLMGADGLARATQVAVLSANYVATRLRSHFPVLYAGDHGLVAHECILDIRPLTKATGVTVEDVAKRLIDYGFHAPTMSFPVAGTLMVEPTESEDLGELDRFIDAMIAIRGEIDQVAAGEWTVEHSPLRHAPHTIECLTGEWTYPYSREVAAYPVPELRRGKYFAPVRRIDGAYGDRNLVCSCPPPEAFA